MPCKFVLIKFQHPITLQCLFRLRRFCATDLSAAAAVAACTSAFHFFRVCFIYLFQNMYQQNYQLKAQKHTSNQVYESWKECLFLCSVLTGSAANTIWLEALGLLKFHMVSTNMWTGGKQRFFLSLFSNRNGNTFMWTKFIVIVDGFSSGKRIFLLIFEHRTFNWSSKNWRWKD